MKEPSAFGPASASSRCPAESKSTAKGTASGSAVTVGAEHGVPSGATPKTSTALVLAFVVTTNCEPLGVKALSPKEV